MGYLTRRNLLTALVATFPGAGLGQRLSTIYQSAKGLSVDAKGPDSAAQAEGSKVHSGAQVQGEKPAYWFTDLVARSSFTYRTNNDFTGRKYFPQPMCGGEAATDFVMFDLVPSECLAPATAAAELRDQGGPH